MSFPTLSSAAPLDPALGPTGLSAWPVRLPVHDGEGWQATLRLGSYEAADAVPVSQLEGDWAVYRPRRGEGAVVQLAQAELAAARRGWELALTARSCN